MMISAPGKLMLSGEWGVLEHGNPCIVLAIDRKVYAEIKEAGEIEVNLKDFGVKTKAKLSGVKVTFEKENEKLLFTKHAIETTLNYLQAKGLRIKKFSLVTWGDQTNVNVKGKQVKVGFGSSAAATVAIIGAILKLHGVSISTEQAKTKLFKLAIIAHHKAQGKIGSGFDVAASVYGGALYYKRFDAEWLEKQFGKKPISEIASAEWPGLETKRIELPKNFEFIVGFSGKSASTTELVKAVNKFKEQKPYKYNQIIEGIKEITENLAEALKEKNEQKVLALIEANRKLLEELGEESGVGLETREHKEMRETALQYGVATKFSGAGGGDCSIGISFNKKETEQAKQAWEKMGYKIIEAKISKEGVSE